MQKISPAYELLLAALRRLLVETDPINGSRRLISEALRSVEVVPVESDLVCAQSDEDAPLRRAQRHLQLVDVSAAGAEERRALAVAQRAMRVALLASDNGAASSMR